MTFRSTNPLPPQVRQQMCEALNLALADGLDLYGQIKKAHWNVKGALFPILHPFFDELAEVVQALNDDVAERVTTLGGLAIGTAREVARMSRLPDYPPTEVVDLRLVRVVLGGLKAYAEGLQGARDVAKELNDETTDNFLTERIEVVEKKGWMLHSTLTRVGATLDE